MAGNTVSVGLQVTAEGLDKVVDQSKQFKNNMQGGANALRAGEHASRGAAKAAYKQENQDYNASRGVAGATGASARDFAQQAQGLGGLVHLYATFAANIFALSAAFTQLSKAADTKNMLEGMSQLSAASGKTLKTLAGQMRDVTDGALSMRDSLNATALATAGGMSNTQILKMTELAKKASSALGRDMADSMDRLTKGIIKVQPELLDELGIMTRVIPAQQAYARALGRSVESLTDFEKKQAFANAVLKEAEMKFGAIDVPANPYSKLSASLSDLATNSLMLVNKILGPFVKLLAESPTALATTVAGFVGMLVSRAIPVLTQWRGSLKDSAEQMAESAKKMKESVPDKWLENISSKLELPRIAGQLRAVEKEADKLGETISTKLQKTSVGKALVASGDDIDPKLFKNLDSMRKARESALAAHLDGTKRLTDEIVNQKQQELAAIGVAKAKITALKEYKEIYDKIEHEANKKQGFLSPEAVFERKYTKAQNTAAIYGIRSNAAENAAQLGIIEAVRSMNKEITDKGLSGWTRFNATVTGTLSAVSSRVMSVVSSLGAWGQAIGLVIAAYGILDSWVSKNTEQLAKYKTSMDQVEESAKVLGDTIKEINRKSISDPLERFNVKSIEAISTAMLGLSDAVASMSKSFNDAKSTRGIWDSAKDTVAYIFGQSDAQQGAKKLAVGLASQIKNMPMGEARDNFIKQLHEVFDFSSTDVKGLLAGLSKGTEEEFSSRLGKISEITNRTATASANSVSMATSATASLDKLNTSYQTLRGNLTDNSPTTQFAISMVEAAANVEKAFKDSTNSLAILQGLLKDPDKMKFLPGDTQKQLKDAEVELRVLTERQATLNEATAKYEELINKKQLDKRNVESTKDRYGNIANPQSVKAIEQDIRVLEAGKDANIAAVNQTTTKLNEVAGRFSNSFGKTMKDGVELITFSFEQSYKRAAIEILNVSASRLQGPGAATIQANLKNTEIELQKAQITTMFNLMKSIEDNTLALEIKTAKDKQESLKGRSDDKSTAELVALSKTIDELDKRQKFRNLAASNKSSPNVIKGAFEELSSDSQKADSKYLVDVLGMRQKLTELDAKAAANNLDALYKERDATFKLIQDRAQATINEKQAQADKLAQLASYASAYDTQIKKEARDAADQVAIAKESLELEKAKFDYETQALAIAKLGKNANLEESRKVLQAAAEKITQTKDKQDLDSSARTIKANLAGIKDQYDLETKLAEDRKAWISARRKAQDADMSSNKSQLDYLTQVGILTKEQNVQGQISLEIQAARVRSFREQEELQESLNDKFRSISNKEQLAIASLGIPPEAGSKLDEYTAKVNSIQASAKQEMQIQQNLHSYTISQLTTQLDLETKLIAAKGAHNSMLDRQATLMEKMQSIAESLSISFGNVGENIGKVSISIIAAMQSMEQMAKKGEDLKAAGDNEDSDKYKEYIAERTKAELTSIGSIAGASKKLFKEKSAAYKVLDGMEKASNLLKVGLMIKEMLLDKALVTQKIIGDSASAQSATNAALIESAAAQQAMFANAGNAIATQGSGDPYSAFGRIAAMAAIMTALLTAFGAGSGSFAADMAMPAGTSAKDRQETQGTGMSWKLNEWGEVTQQENGRGVFGDASSKSYSIENSLKILRDNSLEGISYDQETIRLLDSINLHISDAARSLYRISGIRMGSAFGTKEGKSGGGGGLLSGLFGTSSTSTEITDSGVRFQGTFSQLMDGVIGTITQYEDVLNTTTSTGALWGLFGGSSSQSLITNIKDLDQKTTTAISLAFKDSGSLIIQFGKKVGLSTEQVMEKLSNLPVEALASLKGLKGDELTKELSAIVGSITDDAASAVFSNLKKYAKFGEGMLETATRVIKGGEIVSQVFDQAGMSLITLSEEIQEVPIQLYAAVDSARKAKKKAEEALEAKKQSTVYSAESDKYVPADTTKEKEALAVANSQLAEAERSVAEATGLLTTKNYEVTESLIDSAGGLDKFIERSKRFSDKFLTEGEKTGSVIRSWVKEATNLTNVPTDKFAGLKDEIRQMGLNAGMTRSQYVAMLRTIDVTTERGRATYNYLMSIMDVFDEFASKIDNIAGKLGMSAKDIENILSSAVKNAKSEEEARQLGTQGFADGLNQALQASLITGISDIIYQSVITPLVTNLATSSTSAALNIVTGGAVGASNMAAGSAAAGANMAAGSAAAGANMAAGGAAAGTNIVSGSQIAAATIAGAVDKIKTFVTTFIDVMKDPEVKAALKELAGSFGDFAAMAYTGSAAINNLTTSIGGTTKAATGTGGGNGGAAGASDDLTNAWQAATDAIFAEVKRIKDAMLGSGSNALNTAKSNFEAATLAARAGDLEQAKMLPELSRSLLSLAEANASSALELRKIQASTAASLETTGLGAATQFKLKVPSYDVGTNYVPKDMLAQIHEGEEIIPKPYVDTYGANTVALIAEVRELRRQVSQLIANSSDINDNTKKTRDVLVRVTEDGRAMQSETI